MILSILTSLIQKFGGQNKLESGVNTHNNLNEIKLRFLHIKNNIFF